MVMLTMSEMRHGDNHHRTRIRSKDWVRMLSTRAMLSRTRIMPRRQLLKLKNKITKIGLLGPNQFRIRWKFSQVWKIV
jgi:hypothetical protein